MPKDLLVVEDERKFSRALKAFFEEKGFRVATAATAQAALDQWRHVPAEVVLLDLKLPDRSGLEVLSQLKDQSPNLRVIVISGLLDQETIHEALQRGASEYLTKPVDFDRCFLAAMGIALVDLSTVQPDPQLLQEIPAALALQHQILPLRRTQEGTLELVMADPLNEARVAELKTLLKCDIKPMASVGADVLTIIDRWYRVDPQPSTSATESSVASTGKAPEAIARLFHELIQQAARDRVTDVHVGIGSDGPWMRQRIDGVVYQVLLPPSFAASYSEVIAHVKRLAHLNLEERHVPQEGRIRYEFGATRRPLLISLLPTLCGEHLAIRLLESTPPLTLEQLGLSEEQGRQLNALITKRGGLILLTGPAGSGTSSSGSAILSRLNTGHANVVTIEETIDGELPGITQLQTSSTNAFTFAEGLRAALRHDPDVVLIGELRDEETARLALWAALTGRLVLAGLPTRDATSAITRLVDMGLEPFLLCSALSGILSQRLIRLLCPHCQESVQMPAATLRTLGITVNAPGETLPLRQSRGCTRCRGTGYHGRTAIFELLTVDHHIRSLMLKQVSGAQLRQSALCRGMHSLWQAGWQQVLAGRTSLKELLRVLPSPHQP